MTELLICMPTLKPSSSLEFPYPVHMLLCKQEQIYLTTYYCCTLVFHPFSKSRRACATASLSLHKTSNSPCHLLMRSFYYPWKTECHVCYSPGSEFLIVRLTGYSLDLVNSSSSGNYTCSTTLPLSASHFYRSFIQLYMQYCQIPEVTMPNVKYFPFNHCLLIVISCVISNIQKWD